MVMELKHTYRVHLKTKDGEGFEEGEFVNELTARNSQPDGTVVKVERWVNGVLMTMWEKQHG